MTYKYYKIYRNITWEILKKYRINKLPIPIVSVCREMGVKLKYYENTGETTAGKSLIIDGVPYILLKRNAAENTRRFIVAHELGHIVLKHVCDEEMSVFNYDIKDKKSPLEAAANAFAVRLLAPSCVLWGCRTNTAADIERLCGIPAEYAAKRLKRLNYLREQNRFLSSTDETEVYNNFLDFIENYNAEKFRLPPHD